MAEDQKLKHIIRVGNTDLTGKKAIATALTKIKGIGDIYANMVCRLAEVDTHKRAGHLTPSEVDRLNDLIQNPDKYNVPDWMMNRRKDYETGKDKHVITAGLQFIQEQDVRRLKKIKSYRGFRHAAGLPVRGQRTKGNFRRNKGKAIGVKRKKGSKSGRV